MKITTELSLETIQVRRQWSGILKDWNLKNKTKKPYQPRILNSQKILFKNENKIRTFSDIQKLKEFITSRPVLVLQDEWV